MNDKTLLIKASGVEYTVDETEILKNINFEIYKSDFIGIIGPNGAGKSTLLKLILKEITSYNGKIEVFGKIGYVPQFDTIDRNFPIKTYEVVLMGLYKETGIFKTFSKKQIERVRNVLKLLEIEYTFDRQVGKLSGGEYRRVLLARALVSDPDILILDEPEAGVDTNGQKIFYDILSKLNKEKNMTIMLVSHDMNIIFRETNKIMCLNHTLTCHKETREVDAKDLKHLYTDGLELLMHVHEHAKVVDEDE